MDETAYLGLSEEKKKLLHQKVLKLARDEYLACLFTRQVEAGRYGDLKKAIINDGLEGGSLYRKDLETAAALLKGYQPTIAEKQSQNHAAEETNNSGVAFAQP